MEPGANGQEISGKTPSISVVMPVHNALPFLDAAIESILHQEESDFEFVILDDASTDGSRESLREWERRDGRIRLIEAERNLGPALSSQLVANCARAPLVARMDADDISSRDRLLAQLNVFKTHPDSAIVACLCDFIDCKGATPRDCERWRLNRRSVLAPFAHGTIMYRRELFDRIGGYREQCVFWEDQDLAARMAAEAPVLVIPRPLYRYRLSNSSTRIASNQEQLEHSVDLMYRSVERLEKHKKYDDLLVGVGMNGRKVDPRVFVSLGSQVLWAGGRPRLFRRMLRRSSAGLNLNTIAAAVWTAWASASPATLRTFLRLLVRLRNSLARAKLNSNDPVIWNRGAFREQSRPATTPTNSDRWSLMPRMRRYRLAHSMPVGFERIAGASDASA